MALLDQHLALKASDIRKLLDCFTVCAGNTPGSTAGERARSARGDHCGLGSNDRGNALAHLVLQLNEVHVVLGSGTIASMTSGGISEAVMVVKVPAALIKVRTPEVFEDVPAFGRCKEEGAKLASSGVAARR